MGFSADTHDMERHDNSSTQVIHLGPLTFVYYREDDFDLFCAHCLELNIGGQGASRDEAINDLKDAIDAYLLGCLEHRIPIESSNASDDLNAIEDRAEFQVALLLQPQHEECPEHREVFFARPPQTFTPDLAVV